MRTIALICCVLSLTCLPAVNCVQIPWGQVCTTEFAYGLSATVVDADTGDSIDNAVLTLRENDYTEVMDLLPTDSYAGAGERPGTYNLTIEVPNVPAKTIYGIEIDAGVCHVQGKSIEIRVADDGITVVPKSFACTEQAVAGVSVMVIDAITNQPITDATLTLTAGDYTETLQAGTNGWYGGAAERADTYNLSITAEGYSTVHVEDITVTQGVCHVNPVDLHVELQPAP